MTTFEKENNVVLPSKYKEWLQLSDGGEFFLPAGIQLYGIEHKPVINVNDNSRPNDDYIVIGALASGDPIICAKIAKKNSYI
ncbi:SMI1/KNR4 family protein [Amylolactobacillus amylophilus]|uniref:SMI1/KNR4 family protein n=1 Tax=Amylolactobacillus amylophilus TaxID=1603 RepID=UPI0034E20913